MCLLSSNKLNKFYGHNSAELSNRQLHASHAALVRSCANTLDIRCRTPCKSLFHARPPNLLLPALYAVGYVSFLWCRGAEELVTRTSGLALRRVRRITLLKGYDVSEESSYEYVLQVQMRYNRQRVSFFKLRSVIAYMYLGLW